MMQNGVMMQYFEWYLESDPHLWKLLKEDAKHLPRNWDNSSLDATCF